MISNLFSAVAIALLSSVMVCGDVKSNEVHPRAVAESYSWVTGLACDVYATGSLHKTFLHGSTYGNFEARDYSNTLIDNDSIVIEDYAIYIETLYEQYGVTSNDCYTISYGSITPFNFNEQSYSIGFRVGVPYQSGITGFEFRSNANCIIFRYSTIGVGTYIPYGYVFHGQNTTSIGLYENSSYSATDSDFLHVLAYDTENTLYEPYLLSDFLVVFADNQTGHTDLDLIMDYQFISGGVDNYSIGYNNGYNAGFTDGKGIGWQNGYAEGLNTATTGSFNQLFASLADTPLRFLYGLFNFDLFGTSVLVIVLSLLTGIIVFGLVRKFWH